MSEVKCEFCGSMIDDQLEKCPNCAGINKNIRRTVKGTPTTIAQLEQWYKDRNLPPYETTRFFIGMDYKYPKAFGIYQEGDRFIVYKNKDTGERAIRYEGTDEAYAVNELYLRLKSEIVNQKENNHKGSSSSSSSKKDQLVVTLLTWLTIFLTIVLPVSCAIRDVMRTGYYPINDTTYYYDSDLSSWYSYDVYYDDWYRCSEPATEGSIWDYQDSNFASEWTGADPTDSYDYRVDYEEHQSSSDSDSDWSSSDSWDSGSTDWGSDW